MGNITLPIIKFSKRDINRSLKIPETLSEKLAEDIGIHIGDGCMNVHKDSHRTNYQLVYSCSYHEELQYFNEFLRALKIELYGIKPYASRLKNEFRLTIRSKTLVNFYSNVFNLPVGPKTTIDIPSIILSDKKFIISCLRGIMDTDFCLLFKKKENNNVHNYPVIMAGFRSEKLINSLSNIFNFLGISNFTCFRQTYIHPRRKFYPIYHIYISGKKNLRKWWEMIGSSNTRLITRFEIYKKFGFYPPRINLQDRIKILNEEIDPLEFYKNIKRPGRDLNS